MPLVEPRYDAVHHGTGTVAVDSTAGQYMAVTGDDEYTPIASNTARPEGILYKDRSAGEHCTLLTHPGGNFTVEYIEGAIAVGEELEVNATTAFPKKHAGGAAFKLGKVVGTDGSNHVVKSYI